jgi:ferredoxin
MWNDVDIETCHAGRGRDTFLATKELFMADAANRYAENIAGKYYVDNQCIDCDLCRETAPDNFKRSDDGGYSFVYKQPESPEEEARCKEAKEGCPVEAPAANSGPRAVSGQTLASGSTAQMKGRAPGDGIGATTLPAHATVSPRSALGQLPAVSGPIQRLTNWSPFVERTSALVMPITSAQTQ